MSRAASIDAFQDVVGRIRANSWFSDQVMRDRVEFYKITIDNTGAVSLTEVPSEAFDSLLLNVRKLTLSSEPQQLLKVLRKLKQDATSDQDRELLEVWRKYWRLALIKEPFLLTHNDGSYREVLTPYRVYDAFLNGHYFHSDDQCRTIVRSNGLPRPSARDVQPFLLNLHHATTCQLAFAALGLDRYIQNGCTFANFPIGGAGINEPSTVSEFVYFRKKVAQLDEQYRIFSDWIEQQGGGDNCRWK